MAVLSVVSVLVLCCCTLLTLMRCFQKMRPKTLFHQIANQFQIHHHALPLVFLVPSLLCFSSP